MSGAMVPYHIRPNKYVERQLFIELLSHVDKVVPIVDYLYVSMGGRLLEDFKLLHGRLNLLKMMSIECDEVTYQGQLFNCPMGHIDCRRMKRRRADRRFRFPAEQVRGRQYRSLARLRGPETSRSAVVRVLDTRIKTRVVRHCEDHSKRQPQDACSDRRGGRATCG